ncbi:MAG: hypothetical protein K0R54_1235 [Clostridiaceae bacterium]|nr:hypothetical protein [Clostridiaceae bacterium]
MEKRPDISCGKPEVFCGKVKAETVPMCDSTRVTPTGVNGPLVAKIPVVLAEKDIQIDVEAKIELKEDFFEIKRIKKDVFLTQCKLIPTAGRRNPTTGELISGKLFLSGFVQKNIEFATAKCVSHEAVSGNIQHTTVKVPFRCVTEVEFERQPIIRFRVTQREIEFLEDHEKEGKCKEAIMGVTPCEKDFEDEINFTEEPFCELVSARIFEADINKEHSNYEETKEFEKIEEKMVIFLRIKVLQVQQVNIR